MIGVERIDTRKWVEEVFKETTEIDKGNEAKNKGAEVKRSVAEEIVDIAGG